MGLARLAGGQTRDYTQSIIGAMEQRRESGAAVAEIGGIGGTESAWPGSGGVDP